MATAIIVTIFGLFVLKMLSEKETRRGTEVQPRKLKKKNKLS